jgi:hypothetical protein
LGGGKIAWAQLCAMQSFHSKPIGMQILHISKQGFTKKRHSLNNLSTSYEKFAC